MKNHLIEQVKDYIREPYAWPGGYQKVLTVGGELLCPECARANFRSIARQTLDGQGDWVANGVSIFYEGDPEPCCHCGHLIHAAYCDCEECEPAVA